MPPLPPGQDNRQVLQAEGPAEGRSRQAVTGIGENTLAQAVKPPLRERRACLAKLVKNRLTLTGARVADKTVLKMMREMGIRCGIRRETDYHRYSSYKGAVGETFENVIGRDFSADAPWQKMGTDVTEFKQPWGKAYFAPVYDFGSKEIVAWSTSASPDMEQQELLLDRLLERMPEGARPVLHSDMGWQYQHERWTRRLRKAEITQSMSRKGNCIDNGATEQVFGHIKDEFFRGRTWPDFESFKADLDAYIVHWNTRRRQVKLKGLTPEEFRSQSRVA
ncbi:IS3 family transposase [Adlercreutzia sp.]|uniref:IS3 family transposase n=1 Tax=Adlercreutzia sp. TaxID=1872387 RepID=UPI003AABAFD4